MKSRNRKQKRIYEVSRGQIWAALIIAAFALTIVFELGVWIGKKRVMDAEREAALEDEMQIPAAMKTSTGGPTLYNFSADRSTEWTEAGEDTELEATLRSNTQMSVDPGALAGEDLRYSSPADQSTQHLGTEEKKPQYTVQVGTFRSRQNAEDLVKSLESYGYESWLRPELYGEETLYSVLVGRLDTRDEAEVFGRALRERLLYVTGYMVRKI